MQTASHLAKAHLESAAQAKDKTKILRWLMKIAALAVLALVTFASVDYGLLLPLPLRQATSALLALAMLLGLWGCRTLLRKPTSLKEAALDAEMLRSEMDCVVSTAAEYASGKAPAANVYEPELAAALQSVAAQRLGAARLPYGRTLRGPSFVLAMALTAFALFVVITPAAWTALKRVSLPWLGSQYTQVDVQPRNVELPMGYSVEIVGRFSGRPPQGARILWSTNEGRAWQTALMTPTTNGAYAHQFSTVTVPIAYRVSGGDATSLEFQVNPYFPPAVQHLQFGLAYPDYTKLKPVTQTAPDITILRGSTATMQLRANVNLSRARLLFSDTNLAPVDLQPGPGTNDIWTGQLPIGRNTDYRIELFDLKARRGETNPWHHLVATPDLAPKVELLEPAQDMRADATNRIPVRVSVADDYGVAEINLVYHKLNGAGQTVVCRTESARNGEWIATAEIDLSTLGLNRYDVVAYHVEARDNNTLDGPGVGRSPLYFVEITDQPSAPTPPMPPMPGEQINLLVVQKQIVADTTALESTSPATNYVELAARQTNTMTLGRMYLATMTGAPAEAIAEMNAAIAAMEQAVTPLNQRDRAAALPPEETALAHLYRVLALQTNSTMLAVKPPPPPLPKEQKPQTAVTLREIKKPAPETAQADPDIEEALQEARELSQAQALLNAIGEKLAKAERPAESAATDAAGKQSPGPTGTNQPPANAQGDGDGKGAGQGQAPNQGQGDSEGKGQGPGQGNGDAASPRPENLATNAPAINNTNSQAVKPSSFALTNQTALTNPIVSTNQLFSTNLAAKASPQSRTPKNPADAPRQKQPTARATAAAKAKAKAAQLARAKSANGQGTKPGKGQGKGQGQASASGPKGKGQGQGAKPGDGSGQPSAQASGEPPEMAAETNEPAPETPEELALEQEELSAEAKALGEMLRRLAGKGTRVGHNLARSANQAAEHMEGAAQALKQGNASGAGRRGTQSSAELDQLVGELERILGKRPALTDVASEEAPKEYEAFISEYFKKLSYEK